MKQSGSRIHPVLSYKVCTGKKQSLSQEIDVELLSMIEGYTPMQLKAFMSILKGIQDICKYVA